MKQLSARTILLFFLGAVIYAVGAATRAGVPGMVFDVIRAELGFSAPQTAGIASAGVFGCMTFIGVSGVLIDRFGWKPLILAGVFFQVFGEWMLYSHTEILPIYAGAFLNGGGRTVGYLALLKILDLEFDRKYFSVLIGVFYVFSYGGTLLGSSPFEAAASRYPWQTILQWCNYLTTTCGAAIAVILTASAVHRRRKCCASPCAAASPRRKFPWRELFGQLKKRQCLAVFFCTSSGLVIYWSLLAAAGKKYLLDICGSNASALGVMNGIVMAEMIFAGSVSFLFGNRRKVFQTAGSVFLAAGITALLIGTMRTGESAVPWGWAGFLLIGAGYGFTGINITACREFVPPEFAASAIGFVNFCANIIMIGFTQLGGAFLERFQLDGGMRVKPEGYRFLLFFYLLLALPAVIAAFSLRDTRGRNISAEIR